MPRNIAHQAQRKLEPTVKRLRAFCVTEHGYTTPESLWAAIEKKRIGAAFFFDFARSFRLNRKTRHPLLRLKGRPESRAANHFKEEFFNLYKILHLRGTSEQQDEDTPRFACVGRQDRIVAAARGSYEATVSGKDASKMALDPEPSGLRLDPKFLH